MLPALAAVALNTSPFTGPGYALTQVHNNGSQSGDNVIEGDTASGPTFGQIVTVAGSGNLTTNGFGYSQTNGPFPSLVIALSDVNSAFDALEFHVMHRA